MSIAIRPAFCPACETPELIEKETVYATQVRVLFSCPKCHWKLEGLRASQPSVRVFMAPTTTMRGMRAHEALDQPMTRYYGPVDRVPLEERALIGDA